MIYQLGPHLVAAIAMRDANKFIPITWETLDRRIMATLAEVLREVVDAYEQRDDEALAEELADVALYLMTILHDLGDTWWPKRDPIRPVAALRREESADTLVRPIQRQLVIAWEEWRRLDCEDMAYNARQYLITTMLEDALRETCALSEALGVDLPKAVGAKIQKNLLRPPRHGGKNGFT